MTQHTINKSAYVGDPQPAQSSHCDVKHGPDLVENNKYSPAAGKASWARVSVDIIGQGEVNAV